VESGGAALPYQSEVFPDKDHFGRIFYNMAQLSAASIPYVPLVSARASLCRSVIK
jgi:3-methylcrotonyl-CoA carboxylase beta subunit